MSVSVKKDMRNQWASENRRILKSPSSPHWKEHSQSENSRQSQEGMCPAGSKSRNKVSQCTETQKLLEIESKLGRTETIRTERKGLDYSEKREEVALKYTSPFLKLLHKQKINTTI